MSAKKPSGPPTVTDDGRLRVPAHTTIYLPDEPSGPGTMMATTYNHATTVRITAFRASGPGKFMAVWGPANKRKAAKVTEQDMLDLVGYDDADH